jgi:undecaprenyl pyrophosphate phosphatase UppP
MNLKANGRGEILALTLLAASETAHVFAQFEPSVFTIVALAAPSQNSAYIRIGYIPALMLGLGIATAISWITKSNLPILASLAVGGFTIGVYEWALSQGGASA